MRNARVWTILALTMTILNGPQTVGAADCLTTAAMPPRECLQDRLNQERERMARALEASSARIEAFRRPALAAMQDKWRAYRDAKCGFYVHRHAGTGGVLDALQCEIDETRRRTQELRDLH